MESRTLSGKACCISAAARFASASGEARKGGQQSCDDGFGDGRQRVREGRQARKGDVQVLKIAEGERDMGRALRLW